MRSVGYIRQMTERPRIAAVEPICQRTHIEQYTATHGLCLMKLYEDATGTAAYRQLCEDVVHRDFDILILDNIYCFGSDLFAAADFIENVMLPLGFQLYLVSEPAEPGAHGWTEYLARSKGRMRASLAAVSYQRNKEMGVRSKRTRKRPVLQTTHALAWYEARQIELFQEMLRSPDNFEALEEEMQFCRKAIKKLKV